MNEHKEFDDYIKGFFDIDPAVPSELAWEQMAIDLPNTKKRNYWKYFALLLLFLWGFSMILYQVQVQDQVQNQNYETLKFAETGKQNLQKIAKTTNSLKEEIKKLPVNSQLLHSKPVQQAILQNIKEVSTKINNPPTVLVKESKNQTNKPSFKKEIQLKEVVAIHKPIVSLAKSSNPTINSVSVATEETEKVSTTESIEKLPIIYIKRLTNVLNQLTIITAKPVLLEKNEVEEEKFKVKEIFAGYGNNSFSLNIDDSNILKNKLTVASGKSFEAGVRLNFNTKWNGKLALKFNEYRTLFNHSRNLKPIYESNFKINRTEVTRHLNFTKTVDLQLGIERRWELLKKLHLYSGIGITSTYTQSTDGKTTDGVLVNNLSGEPAFDSEASKFSVNGGIDFGISYAINRSLNAELTYQYNQFFVNGVFINNGILAKQQRSVSLLLSYQFNR